jgi:signal transduction histidine kinase
LTREISFQDRALRVTVAENRALLDESIRQFGGDLILALIFLGVALMIASALQIWLGLRPLEHIRSAVGAVRHGRLDALPVDYPSEIQPLATEVNELLAAQTAALEFARARAADLAHSLKTPLTVMATLSPRLKERGDDDGAALLDRLVGEMDDRVAYQLRLSRLRHRTREHQLSVPLADPVNRAVDVLKRTPAGENLAWRLSLGSDLRVDIDRQDLQELVGILLENASKWALTAVSVRSTLKDSTVAIEISDDGPGLPEGGLPELGKRGHRLDESNEGSGLGLSIAREIVSINGGSISFSRSDEGGLLVRVALTAGETRP